MMGIKDRTFEIHPIIHLEDLVPADNFYREVEAKLDLSFTRELVQHLYPPYGRPSIDPVVFFQVATNHVFLRAFVSERQLMEKVNMRLDHRWYIGYDLNEIIPDHSSLTRIRDRYGLAIFPTVFLKLSWHTVLRRDWSGARSLYFDGSLIEANAGL